MKKLNSKAFTLIELLAVITIMGILMIVAIPSVSRVIENTRKDNFLDTAKQYVNGVKTMWMSDSLECDGTLSSALGEGTYYVKIDSEKVAGGSDVGAGTLYPIILESGGKSSWGNKDVKGFVKVKVSVTGAIASQKYYVRLTDGSHGVADLSTEYGKLKRGQVLSADPTGAPYGDDATLVKTDVATSDHVGSSLKEPTTPVYCKEV